jgi:hypothetical protein
VLSENSGRSVERKRRKLEAPVNNLMLKTDPPRYP